MVSQKNPWMKYIITLGVLIVLLLIVRLKERKHEQKVSDVFLVNTEDVTSFTIIQGNDSVTLVKGDSTWTFAEPDTGIINEQKLNGFLTNVIPAKKTGYVTTNPEKYAQYNVVDSLGINVILKQGETKLTEVIVGASAAYSHDYIKYSDDPKVYISQKKISYMINPKATFWR